MTWMLLLTFWIGWPRFQLWAKRGQNGPQGPCCSWLGRGNQPLTGYFRRAPCRIRTDDPRFTRAVLWPTELKGRAPEYRAFRLLCHSQLSDRVPPAYPRFVALIGDEHLKECDQPRVGLEMFAEHRPNQDELDHPVQKEIDRAQQCDRQVETACQVEHAIRDEIVWIFREFMLGQKPCDGTDLRRSDDQWQDAADEFKHTSEPLRIRLTKNVRSSSVGRGSGLPSLWAVSGCGCSSFA